MGYIGCYYLGDLTLDNENKKFIVYCHTNKVNGKRYIGLTCQKPNQRFRNGNGYKDNKHFYAAIQKYGWDNFEHSILFDNLTQTEAQEKEIYLIAKYNPRNPLFGYNITPGGNVCSGSDSPWYGKHHTEATKQKMSEQRTGVHKTEEWKRRISESNKGKIVSAETRARMSKNHANVAGENNPCFGRKLTDEHIAKMVKASKTKEAIEKMKQNKVWYSGKDNPNAKKVMCLETGVIYDTVKDAALNNGCTPSKVSAVCHGYREHTNNLHFKILEELNE